MPELTIRRLGPGDGEIWRLIRLEALAGAPEAFGQTHDFAASQPTTSFEKAVSSPNPIVAAIAGDRPVGTAGIYVIDGPKSAHRGMLWGIYVTPDLRDQGLARRLIEAVIAVAPAGIEQLHLRVVADNHVAYRLYRRMGFVAYGIEPRALRWNGRDYDETMMLLDLSRHSEVRSLRGSHG
jgi:ribosomal protein S18 acetylase RimI-like enzyme